MAKYQLRIKARKLRQNGESIKSIAKQLNVTKGTVSLWVTDINLTIEQLENLRQASLNGAERGRFKSALLKKEKRNKIIEQLRHEGIQKLENIREREFFIAGLALYWAEGGKKNRRVEFCNSDSRMIKFLLDWLVTFFKVDLPQIKCTIGINEIHREREQKVKEFWTQEIGVSLEQFTKTSFKKVKNLKVYDNFDNHFGTLSILIRKSTNMQYQILGLIEGLILNSLDPIH